jgi:hypothetical protein
LEDAEGGEEAILVIATIEYFFDGSDGSGDQMYRRGA